MIAAQLTSKSPGQLHGRSAIPAAIKHVPGKFARTPCLPTSNSFILRSGRIGAAPPSLLLSGRFAFPPIFSTADHCGGPSASRDRPTCRLRRRQPIGLRRCSASRGRWCAASERLRSPSARSRCSSPARRCCRRCHCDTMDMPRRSREHVARMQRSPRGRRQSRQTPSRALLALG